MTTTATTTTEDVKQPSCAECGVAIVAADDESSTWQLEQQLLCSEDCRKLRLSACPTCQGAAQHKFHQRFYRCEAKHVWRLCQEHNVRTTSLKVCTCVHDGKVTPTTADLLKFSMRAKKPKLAPGAWDARHLAWHLRQRKQTREQLLASLTDRQLITMVEQDVPVSAQTALAICLDVFETTEVQLCAECVSEVR